MDMEDEKMIPMFRDLLERQKELNCLYKISNLLKTSNEPIENLIDTVIHIIPKGYQYPEICRVQININNKQYQHQDLRITNHKQTSKIKVEGKDIGEINVFYIKPVKSKSHEVFLDEEQKLIDAIADEINQYLTISHFRNLVKTAENKSIKFEIPLEFSHWLSTYHLSDNQVDKLLVNKLNFKSKELIVKQGSLVSYSFILTKGLVRLTVGNMRGKDFIFKIAKPFEFIGLPFLAENEQWGYSASAITNTEGFVVNVKELKTITLDNEGFRNALIGFYNKTLNLLFNNINLLANKQAPGRLANTLIYLWDLIFEKKIIENIITRQTIAELSGISTENAVRILSEFRNDELISITKKGIEIINPEMIKKIAFAG